MAPNPVHPGPIILPRKTKKGNFNILDHPNPIRDIWEYEFRKEQAAKAAAASARAATAPGASSLAPANQPQCTNKSCKDPKVVDGTCRGCGRIVDDSNIVAEVQFGESSTGAAIVQGSYMGADQGSVRPVGPLARYIASLGLQSREKAVQEAKVTIQGFAQQLYINETRVDSAVQFFKLCRDQQFVKGRSLPVVLAVCLYTACRLKRPCKIMLIDLADLLHVNVFKLGNTFKALLDLLVLNLDPVFPEDLIYRFAATLEFGQFTSKVAETAVRLVRRMTQDWMVVGRRPSGVCGACLIMAARIYNFRRTVREVVYVVKVTSHTIQKRFDEFSNTASSNMTVEDFLKQDFLESAHDPPSFYQKSEEHKRLKQQKGRKRKRARLGPDGDDEGDDDIEDGEASESQESAGGSDRLRTSAGPSGVHLSSATTANVAANVAGNDAGTAPTPPDLANLPPVEYCRDADGFIIPPVPSKGVPVDPALELDFLAVDFGDGAQGTEVASGGDQETAAAGNGKEKARAVAENGNGNAAVASGGDEETAAAGNEKGKAGAAAGNGKGKARVPRQPLLDIDPEWEQDERELEDLITEIINDPHSNEYAKAFNTAERRAKVHAMWQLSLQPQREISMDMEIAEDEFAGDPEVENCMLSEGESKVKELIWVNSNKDWLRQQQEKVFRNKIAAAGPPKQTRKRRKVPRIGEGQTAPAATPYEAAIAAAERRGFSKRLNYDAVRAIFEFGGRDAGPGSAASINSEVASVSSEVASIPGRGGRSSATTAVGEANDGDDMDEEDDEEGEDDPEEEDDEDEVHYDEYGGSGEDDDQEVMHDEE